MCFVTLCGSGWNAPRSFTSALSRGVSSDSLVSRAVSYTPDAEENDCVLGGELYAVAKRKVSASDGNRIPVDWSVTRFSCPGSCFYIKSFTCITFYGFVNWFVIMCVSPDKQLNIIPPELILDLKFCSSLSAREYTCGNTGISSCTKHRYVQYLNTGDFK